MLTAILKPLAARLPSPWQQTLKRWHFSRQIRRGTFLTDEPEYARLSEWVRPGDWVIDVGANVGHYTHRLSQLVGPHGRVLAFEPFPETFALLTATLERAPYRNVTPFNLAASDRIGLVPMRAPVSSSGLTNYYRAELARMPTSYEDRKVWSQKPIGVLTTTIDAQIMAAVRVTCVKIDVENHELQALHGMRSVLERDHPVLIVEGREEAVETFLAGFGYWHTETEGSPNRVYFYTTA